MQKAGRRQWQTLVLLALALVLGTGLLIQGVGLLMAWVGPVGSATSKHSSDPGSPQCTAIQHGPVFGQTLIVNEQEVLCGDLTLFGRSLHVRGQVQGTILAFGSNIDIAGNVRGDVNLYGGVATFRNHSHLQG